MENKLQGMKIAVIIVVLLGVIGLTSCNKTKNNVITVKEKEIYSSDIEKEVVPEPEANAEVQAQYILNKNSKKFHIPECYAVRQMKESNKVYFAGNREDAVLRGYDPCQKCDP